MTVGAAPFWRRWPVAQQVLASMLVIAIVTLGIAGAASYLVHVGQLYARIDDDLTREVQEFEALHASGINPENGEPFTSAADLIYLAMQRTSPARSEGMIALHPGGIRWNAPVTVEVRLEEDQELIQRLLGSPIPERIRLTTEATGTTTYRVAVVPVQLQDDPAPLRLVLARDIEAELAELRRTYVVFFGAGLVALAIAAVVAWALVRRLFQPLEDLRRTAQRITAGGIGERIEVTGSDDLADLSHTFNEMLDRLESVLESQRRLLDDVGHELRTPITIVHGHLELTDPEDPEDVRQTHEVALDELDRMSMLVEDLVTLATSDRDDFVQPRPVDVDRLLLDVVDKARALGDRQWRIAENVAATAPLDQRRVTQALLQLCQNAMKFSAPGSEVALGAELTVPGGHAPDAGRPGGEGSELRLWVRDHGVGITEEDAASIFERFTRGANGSRAEGSGLGLTIVRAIAVGHGGRVSVCSTPGLGSIFALHLPVPARLESVVEGR